MELDKNYRIISGCRDLDGKEDLRFGLFDWLKSKKPVSVGGVRTS